MSVSGILSTEDTKGPCALARNDHGKGLRGERTIAAAMQRVFWCLVVIFSMLTVGETQKPRKVPCKTPENATSCYWAHGRLAIANGTPAFRLWKVGTNRVLGIYSGPSVLVNGDLTGDNEDPEFPSNLAAKFHPNENRIFADFEVCPLEKEKPGTMQAACIESAKNIVIQK